MAKKKKNKRQKKTGSSAEYKIREMAGNDIWRKKRKIRDRKRQEDG